MKKPCSYPGCPALVERGNCGQHGQPEPRQQYDRFRGSSSERGYDERWRKFRRWFLNCNPWCADCVEESQQPAIEVHHVQKVREHPELRLKESNCLALCKSCHSIRTARGE